MPEELEITGTMSLFTEHREVYRFTEDVEPGRPKQVSDVYIQKMAMGGHPPPALTFRFAWTKPDKEDDANGEEPGP